MRDIQDDPSRPEVKTRPKTLNPEFKLYHLTSSRDRVSGQPVKGPRHFVIYRLRSGVIEVLRVLHDDETIFSQKGVFRLLSDHRIQHGPSFAKPIGLLINALDGELIWHD